jgi:hypothetical protein
LELKRLEFYALAAETPLNEQPGLGRVETLGE